MLLAVGLIYTMLPKREQTTVTINTESSAVDTPAPTNTNKIIYPIDEFRERITKKPFGIYITPENSPVNPEKFSGYHTAIDVEYEDVDTEVPVYSVCDGEIVLARFVSGYGGAVVLKCGQNFVMYGHLDPNNLTKSKSVKPGEIIGQLGKGNSLETDGERKHLHFGIHKNKLDLRGYVKEKSELDDWYDQNEIMDFFGVKFD
jgi:murein DD-endopeptidase MepM/ murein hydrolase activator NlpD